MNEKLDTADANARRTYIRSIIDTIEVDDNAIRIISSKDVLQAVIAGKQTANGNVRGCPSWEKGDSSFRRHGLHNGAFCEERKMPWKVCKPMDERLKFIARLLDGEKMAGLC